MRPSVRVMAGIAILLVVASIRGGAITQDSAGAWTVDGGGARSAGGGVQVHGTIGQPDAGTSSDPTSPGTGLEVRGGFWNLRTETVVSAPGTPLAARHDLAAPMPNPSNPQTTLRFDLARETHALVQIHDARGRVVSTLVDEVRPAGSHVLRWQGRGDDGVEVASGVYFVRLVAEGQIRTQKMTLIK